MAGNPAKQMDWVCECEEKLSDDLHCKACGKRFKKSKNVFEREDI
jgi:UDP-2-acetamido-3-amino-2,3-dideoxy-glucuronate N-acetyltransferase